VIDWDEFAARVPAGSQAKVISYQWVEGIILENKPFGLIDKSDHFFSQTGLLFAGFATYRPGMRVEAQKMLYLIDGEWLTLIQVMNR
jgi:hypothetical protein